jgi:hypothetical protein
MGRYIVNSEVAMTQECSSISSQHMKLSVTKLFGEAQPVNRVLKGIIAMPVLVFLYFGQLIVGIVAMVCACEGSSRAACHRRSARQLQSCEDTSE